MLREIQNPRQVEGEPRRRWFEDAESDLVVWERDGGEIAGFQFCYGKGRDEHALTWKQGAGFMHERVDDGEGRPFHYKGTPVLVPDGPHDPVAMKQEFLGRCGDIDPEIVAFVLDRIAEYGRKA